MAVTTSRNDRAKGVVYLDGALAAKPSAHVMIIGAGAFASKKVATVTSPPLSALALADWFIDSYRNAERPLGSLSLVLSQHKDGAETEYRGANVPRARYEEAKTACNAWRKRVNSSSDNLLVLYV